MPIVIQETNVQVAAPQGGQPSEAAPVSAPQGAQPPAPPLRPADIERMQQHLRARQARLQAD